MLTEDLLQDARGIADRITALRRAIHAEPELGLETPKTLAKVRDELADLPLEWRVGSSCTGAVAILNAGKSGRSVLLRGDMDALPMPEETGLDFASTVPGRDARLRPRYAHRDARRAARASSRPAPTVCRAKCVSCSSRARKAFTAPASCSMTACSIRCRMPLSRCTSCPMRRTALIGSRVGTLLASADMLEIIVEGRGGHASMPHDTRDPVPVACEIVLALQTMVTRRFNAHEAMVVTITQLEAANAHNIIPGTRRPEGHDPHPHA